MKFTALLVIFASIACAEVVGVRFAAYAGDPEKDPQSIQQLPGVLRVFVNQYLYAEHKMKSKNYRFPRSAQSRKSLGIAVKEFGPRVRRGKNTIELEFEPADANQDYFASISVVSVEVLRYSSSGESVKSKGIAYFPVPFTSATAVDLPWHHYPPVTTLSVGDKQKVLRC
jgi:hypothetical protein